MRSRHAEILSRIEEAVEATVKEMVKADGSLVKAITQKADLGLMINSSFLHRDQRSVKTLQSPQRLVAKVSKSGKRIRTGEVSILDGITIRKHYRILSDKELRGTVRLQQAVSQEVSSLGDLIFVLVGTVKGLRASAQQVAGGAVKELRLTPTLSGEFQKVDDGVYAIKKIMPIEDLFARLSRDVAGQGALSEKDRREIARAYDELLDNATTDVVIPTGGTVRAKETTLGQIVESLRSQTSEYRSAVRRLPSPGEDDHALNEVLRIAYNFSTDVLPLVSLFMSICDLKPLVFWCTVDKQWALYTAFASLPWSALGRKEKLGEYQQIVSQARNRAFHHVLPFDATLEVDLSNLDVRAEKIRLFTPFGQNQARGVLLRDQELADLFGEFSRAKWRPVSNTFWKANLKVMEAATDLAQAILDTLILVHRARKAGR